LAFAFATSLFFAHLALFFFLLASDLGVVVVVVGGGGVCNDDNVSKARMHADNVRAQIEK